MKKNKVIIGLDNHFYNNLIEVIYKINKKEAFKFCYQNKIYFQFGQIDKCLSSWKEDQKKLPKNITDFFLKGY